jgi:hypothetical protein
MTEPVQDISWQARVGLLGGMLAGGVIAGKLCERLKPEVGKVYGLVNAVAIFIIRDLAKKVFGEEFVGAPWYLQVAFVVPNTTLLTGTAANYLNIPLTVKDATMIALGSVAMGVFGGQIGKSIE